MKRRPEDDWGSPIGSDPDAPAVRAPKKNPRRDPLTGMIAFFTDNLPSDAWGKLNAPVNAPALLAALRKLQEAGKTPDEIRGMMVSFIADIKRKPLPNGVAPWRGFIANLDRLSNQPSPVVTESYDDIEIDERL